MASLLERLEKASPAALSGEERGGEERVRGALRRVQEHILQNCPELVLGARGDPRKRGRLRGVIMQTIVGEGLSAPGTSRESLADAMVQEIAGFGPIDPLISDPTVTEVMVNGPGSVYVERAGVLEPANVSFRDEEHLLEVIGRIVAPLGRRIDRSSPYVDARMPDGSRVNAVIPPLSLAGPVLTVRKFPEKTLTLGDLVGLGTLTQEMSGFLAACVHARLNVVVSGGTGSGKTTTLGALCASASASDRLITIEDAAELRISLPHVVALESRLPNSEGKGGVTIRDLLRNALRMRPDRIIIGEVRGPEAYDLLQALNTGHRGSMSTVHANSVADAIRRLENMVLSSGESLPYEVVSDEIRAGIDLLVHQERTLSGARKMTNVSLMAKSSHPGSTSPALTVFSWEPEAVCRTPGGAFRRLTITSPVEVTDKFRLAGMDISSWLGGGAL